MDSIKMCFIERYVLYLVLQIDLPKNLLFYYVPLNKKQTSWCRQDLRLRQNQVP